MTPLKIIVDHLITLVCVFLIYFGIGFFNEQIYAHHGLAMWSFFSFAILSLIICLLGYRTVYHKNKHFFSAITLLSVFVKIALGALLVFIYIQEQKPQDYWYAVPFLISYLCFTIIETYILQKVATSGSKTWKK